MMSHGSVSVCRDKGVKCGSLRNKGTRFAPISVTTESSRCLGGGGGGGQQCFIYYYFSFYLFIYLFKPSAGRTMKIPSLKRYYRLQSLPCFKRK